MKPIPAAMFFICFSAMPVSVLAVDADDAVASGSSQQMLPVSGVVFPAYVLDQNEKISEVSQKVDNANEVLTSISSQISALKQSFWERLYPALFGVLGVAIAGLVNYFLQARQMTHNESERKEKFSFDARQKLFEYRNKQNNEFYGPLLVLLAQSKELSNQLHEQLSKFDPSRYKFEDDSSSGVVKSTLFIHEHASKRPLRLIEELPYLGQHVKDLLPQVFVIIAVGDRMAALIEKSSGLANPKNSELSGCLGKYLAHLTALTDAYKQAEQGNPGGPTRIHTAVFPRKIQELVKADYDEINIQIQEWESEAKASAGSGVGNTSA
ncbi:hypothetical protein [Pseudomonas sp. NFACC13-1]|uniref:hypothetical protein n=1 Tax=Pseudomonas sp. NFACC13-1 TaxID=1566245 RepID=UPI0008812CBC|nr:hypothetical protein [Pseudomonas sp. NFACC13-1]SDB35960.1 hypothetical protein SAMN03159290_02631 [Pseudomonas sp. NFACC13-1]